MSNQARSSPPDDHDGIVERSLRLRDELLRSSSQEDGARLRLAAALEEVVAANSE